MAKMVSSTAIFGFSLVCAVGRSNRDLQAAVPLDILFCKVFPINPVNDFLKVCQHNKILTSEYITMKVRKSKMQGKNFWSAVGGRRSTVNGQRSMVNGQWLAVGEDQLRRSLIFIEEADHR